MSALDRLIPRARKLELDGVDVAVPPEKAWARVRHGTLADSPLVRALFAIRTLPSRLAGGERAAADRDDELRLRLDDMRSSPEKPGFQVLVDDPPHEIAVGAIGKVWQLDIPFVHVADADAFRELDEPDLVKVAWALRVEPRGERDAHIALELRVDATDDEAWRKFRRYFRLIGPGSHFIRQSLLAGLQTELGDPDALERQRSLPGDELLSDAAVQLTHGITIEATPEAIWPWLVQMGCRRAGFYSVDLLDNGGVRSAREIHPELQSIHVGEILPVTQSGDQGFEVLRLDSEGGPEGGPEGGHEGQEPRTLVLGMLSDAVDGIQLPFHAPRPAEYAHVTWAFVLEPLDACSTRLHVRARAALSSTQVRKLTWIRPVHHFMQTAQLRHLKARVEHKLARDDMDDFLEAIGGAARMVFAALTPFRRGARTNVGISPRDAAQPYPGDALVAQPRWGWTHAIDIDASAEEVWPWIAQIGADRGGFYSYQLLENVVGCDVHNAEAIHRKWDVREGMPLSLHPKMPPLQIAEVDRGRYFVAYGAPDETARAASSGARAGSSGAMASSWLFLLQPIDARRCRFISRFRCACSDDLATRATMGPALLEPIGTTMDLRMLRGVKERAEHRHA
ncbi:MAG: hypothetical protein HYV09_32530 [Deltaproteobacteria bacterium]|nr:hypothetical protein [Deltaproteobacteria bacterium]